MKPVAYQSRTQPDRWIVEQVMPEDDGQVYMTFFLGCDAERRAREYAKMVYDAGDATQLGTPL